MYARYLCVCVCVCLCVCVYTQYIYILYNIYTHTHSLTHTHIHTHWCWRGRGWRWRRWSGPPALRVIPSLLSSTCRIYWIWWRRRRAAMLQLLQSCFKQGSQWMFRWHMYSNAALDVAAVAELLQATLSVHAQVTGRFYLTCLTGVQKCMQKHKYWRRR